MKKIPIRPSTEMYIGPNLFTIDRLLEFCDKRRVILIADATIKDLYAVDLAGKIHAELLTIPSGEQAKSRDTEQTLIDKLFKIGCDRDTLLIALGGGVTTDLVGFVASIYMRGLSLILIPTTLLAIVDAAIGGKTAVDTPYGKNLIGTVYYPKAIFIDLNVLQTLPEKEWINGRSEILKMGLVYDSVIWELAKKNEKNPDLILKAIQGKIAIVDQDPTEQGLRRILNFGHTIGHALEAVSHYEMPHGEAVALGCAVETHLSMRLGYLKEQDFQQIQAIYDHFPCTLPKAYDRAKLLSAMDHDKKKARDGIRFVLIDKIGHAIPFEGAYCRTVSQNELEPTLNWMESWKSSH
jgi:3-dehydroquinate synthase